MGLRMIALRLWRRQDGASAEQRRLRQLEKAQHWSDRERRTDKLRRDAEGNTRDTGGGWI
jgi:hypothetical protein